MGPFFIIWDSGDRLRSLNPEKMKIEEKRLKLKKGIHGFHENKLIQLANRSEPYGKKGHSVTKLKLSHRLVRPRGTLPCRWPDYESISGIPIVAAPTRTRPIAACSGYVDELRCRGSGSPAGMGHNGPAGELDRPNIPINLPRAPLAHANT